MRSYIYDVLKAVQSVPVDDSYMSDYVAMRIFNLLCQDSFLISYLNKERSEKNA